jgi:probable selenium-dependent hydroxylase accessory protein YqeC
VESLSLWFEKLIFGENGPAGAGAGPAVITFTGSGGKTSLIWLLARRLSQCHPPAKILVTPAAKMFLPSQGGRFFDRYYNGAPPSPAVGISLSGVFNEKTGKLESLPLPELERIIGGCDLVLIEGDGSKELPLKGWAAHEPVVPSFTDITVGVLPLRPLGKPVNEKIIHRLPLFCALTGAKPEEDLSPAHLAAIISGNQKNGAHSAGRSLFSGACGKKILFINQLDFTNDEAAFSLASGLISLLPPEFRSSLYRIIAGSVRQDTVREIN